MSEVALNDTNLSTSEAVSRAALLKRLRTTDQAFRLLTRAAVLTVLGLFSGVILALIIGSVPAIKAFGPGFVVTEVWNPVTEQFGALAPIYGTLVTSIIAMVIAVPVGLGIAFFITELCPLWLRRPIGDRDRAAGRHPEHHLRHLGPVRLRALPAEACPAVPDQHIRERAGPVVAVRRPPYGIGMLTAGFILAIMVLPFITAISRDVFDAVPPVLKEAPTGWAAPPGKSSSTSSCPSPAIGVIGGVMLGLGRALGETMAVTFVIGNAHKVSASILAPGTTISASIANEFTEAVGDLYTSSLIALGLILFVITFIVLAIAALHAAPAAAAGTLAMAAAAKNVASTPAAGCATPSPRAWPMPPPRSAWAGWC